MKKTSLSLLLALTLLIGCAPALAGETQLFTDDAGREVVLPATVTRVAPSGLIAQIMLLAIAPDAMVGLASEWTGEARQYLGDALDIPVIGQYYGDHTLSLEALLAIGPEVIIDIGETKKASGEDMDALSEQLGIPAIHLNATLDGTGDTFRRLGALLGRRDEAEALAAYCEKVYARTQSLMETVGDDRAQVLYILGAKGLNVIAKDSFHGEVLDMMTENAAAVDEPSSRGTGNEVDMEQLLLWDPEIILFDADSVYATAPGDPLYQQLRAIESGRYAQVPFGPYDWMGFPPSAQRYLGMLWLGDLLYPDAAGYDLYREVAAYFALFYHHDLTRTEFDALTENASFAAAP